MAINRKVELIWNGEKIPVKITMDAIDQIDRAVNIGILSIQESKNEIEYTRCARLVSVLLNIAGKNIETDYVWDAMFSEDGETNPTDVRNLVRHVLSNVFPPAKKKAS